jgi:hypothetical protein
MHMENIYIVSSNLYNLGIKKNINVVSFICMAIRN